jgi:hypothetical protein
MERFITEYRKRASANVQNSSFELELVFTDATYEYFMKVLRGLSKFAKCDISFVTKKLTPDPNDRFKTIIEMYEFKSVLNGPLETINKSYYSKRTMLPPLNVLISVYAPFKLKLSREFADNAKGDLMKATVKMLVRFSVTIGRWRYDLSVTYYMKLSNQSVYAEQRDRMFKLTNPRTIDNVLEHLDLEKEINREMYTYEIEAEYIGNLDHLDVDVVFEGAKRVMVFIDQDVNEKIIHHEKIYYLATKLLSEDDPRLPRFRTQGLKQLLPQAISFSRNEYSNVYPPIGGYVTDKADGVRAVCILKEDKCVLIASRFFRIHDMQKHLEKETILDGEYIEALNTFYAFDIMLSGDVKPEMEFPDRLAGMTKLSLPKIKDMSIKVKEYMQITSPDVQSMKKIFKTVYEAKRDYDIDGIIITIPCSISHNKKYNASGYMGTTNYKWKPLKNNTIDFLVKKLPERAMRKYNQRNGMDVYLLFVGISKYMFRSFSLHFCDGYDIIFPRFKHNDRYFPVQFDPSYMRNAYIYYHPSDSTTNIDGKIVEMYFDMVAKSWKIIKIRDDRQYEIGKNYFGNDYGVAEQTFTNYIDVFKFEDLYNLGSDNYFMTEKTEVYRRQVLYISLLKKVSMRQYRNASWGVDMFAGKGQDLGRFMELRVRNLVVIDKDKSALATLIDRKYSYLRRKNITFAMAIHVKELNLEDHFAANLKSISDVKHFPRNGVDFISCNLGLHYILKTVKHMKNFAALCKQLLKKNGRLVIVDMMGSAVFDKLKDLSMGETWDVFEKNEDKKKYSIKRLFKTSTFTPAGQKIGVLLPFSKQEYYEEYLVNEEALMAELQQVGIRLSKKTPAINIRREISSMVHGSTNMTPTSADFQWIGLFGIMEFVKY